MNSSNSSQNWRYNDERLSGFEIRIRQSHIECIKKYYNWRKEEYPKWLNDKKLLRHDNKWNRFNVVDWPGLLSIDSQMQRGEYFFWIIENCTGEWYFRNGDGSFNFEFEEDAMAFKLRWQK